MDADNVQGIHAWNVLALRKSPVVRAEHARSELSVNKAIEIISWSER
jgi:hypothetical protein